LKYKDRRLERVGTISLHYTDAGDYRADATFQVDAKGYPVSRKSNAAEHDCAMQKAIEQHTEKTVLV
jgi:hypothetical protein